MKKIRFTPSSGGGSGSGSGSGSGGDNEIVCRYNISDTSSETNLTSCTPSTELPNFV